MAEKTETPVSLGLSAYPIFAPVDAPPVAILNKESSTQCRLIYCECVAANLESIADLANGHENTDVQTLASIFANQLHPLLNMLKTLVSEGKNGGGA